MSAIKTKSLLSLAVVLLFCFHCGKAPGPMPDEWIGSIRITASGAPGPESVRVVLDDNDMGVYTNPATVSDVAAGKHKVSIVIGDAATAPQTVEVRRGETTPVTFVYSTGPYPGNPAPLFAVKDVKGDSLSLSKQKGKVVLLVFFEHT